MKVYQIADRLAQGRFSLVSARRQLDSLHGQYVFNVFTLTLQQSANTRIHFARPPPPTLRIRGGVNSQHLKLTPPRKHSTRPQCSTATASQQQRGRSSGQVGLLVLLVRVLVGVPHATTSWL